MKYDLFIFFLCGEVFFFVVVVVFLYFLFFIFIACISTECLKLMLE